jgi:hypothetical protein
METGWNKSGIGHMDMEKKPLTLSVMYFRIGRDCGPLAQLVEHLTFNQGVAGSNPAGPAF